MKSLIALWERISTIAILIRLVREKAVILKFKDRNHIHIFSIAEGIHLDKEWNTLFLDAYHLHSGKRWPSLVDGQVIPTTHPITLWLIKKVMPHLQTLVGRRGLTFMFHIDDQYSIFDPASIEFDETLQNIVLHSCGMILNSRNEHLWP